MTAKDIFWLHDYSDETVPCDCSLDGWAAWLAKPDDEYGRTAAAKDGETFTATKAHITYHTARIDDLARAYDPPLPEHYSFLAVCYSGASGWDSESLCDDEATLADMVNDGDVVAAVAEEKTAYLVTYNDNPPRCTVAPGQ